jgi:hypothetical protein
MRKKCVDAIEKGIIIRGKYTLLKRYKLSLKLLEFSRNESLKKFQRTIPEK